MYPKVIRTEEENEAALKRIEALWKAEPGTPEADELELWVTLVEKYENEQYPITTPDPITAITFHMQQAGLKQADLIPYIGRRSKVSEVLSGKRNLSLSMIRALHKGLDIPAEVLIQGIKKPAVKKQPAKQRKSLARTKRIAAKAMRKPPPENKGRPTPAAKKNNRKSR